MFLYYLYYFIGLLRRTAFFGCISLLIYLLGFKEDFLMVLQTAERETFVGLFCKYMLISMIALLIIEIIYLIARKRTSPDKSTIEVFFSTLVFDIVAPISAWSTCFITILRATWLKDVAEPAIDTEGREKIRDWTFTIFDALWYLLLALFIIGGFIFLI